VERNFKYKVGDYVKIKHPLFRDAESIVLIDSITITETGYYYNGPYSPLKPESILYKVRWVRDE